MIVVAVESRREAPIQARENSSMISRHWRGIAKLEQADDYIEHLRSETLPRLSRISGFAGVSVLRRRVRRGVEFLVVTNWVSIDAIERFSGRQTENAVVPQAVHEMMVDYDRTVRHYEMLV